MDCFPYWIKKRWGRSNLVSLVKGRREYSLFNRNKAGLVLTPYEEHCVNIYVY